MIARDKALWRGHPVAAVAATDAYIAHQAIELIDVVYEVLPPVMDIGAAMSTDAPLIYPDHKPKGFDAANPAPRNAGGRTLIERGDAGRALVMAAKTSSIHAVIDNRPSGLHRAACVRG